MITTGGACATTMWGRISARAFGPPVDTAITITDIFFDFFTKGRLDRDGGATVFFY